MKHLLHTVAVLFIMHHFAEAENLQWVKQIEGNSPVTIRDVTTDASGNIYYTGDFYGTVDLNPHPVDSLKVTSQGSGDIFISKMDASGNLIWAKTVGGNASDLSYGVAVDAQGNVYVTGAFFGTVDFNPDAGTDNLIGSGNGHGFVWKLSSSGSYLWAKQFTGTLNVICRSIAVDGSGNVYTSGAFYGDVDLDPGSGTYTLSPTGAFEDAFISKLNSSGDFVWGKQIEVRFISAVGPAISLDGNNNLYVTGIFEGKTDLNPGTDTTYFYSLGDRDAFVLKLNDAGNLLWAKQIGGSLAAVYSYACTADAQGNVFITGTLNETADFNPDSNTTNNLMSISNFDLFVCKLNSSGSYVWAKNMGGSSGFIEGRGISVDAQGNVFTTGFFEADVDFDPDAGTFIVPYHSFSRTDAFISKLDASGNFAWAGGIGGTDDTQGYSIATDNNGNIYTVGNFRKKADFDPGTDSLFLTAPTAGGVPPNGFVLRLGTGSTGISTTQAKLPVIIFPNPASSVLNIETSEKITRIKIADLTGKTLADVSSPLSPVLDVGYLTKGYYLVYVETLNGNMGVKPFLKH